MRSAGFSRAHDFFLAGRTSPLCRFIETFVEEMGDVDMTNLLFCQ